MSENTEKTVVKEYVIVTGDVSNVKLGEPDYEIGEIVKFTDDQAQKRVNKIRLKDAAGDVDGRSLKGKLEKLKAEYNDLNNKYEALKKQVMESK